MAFEHNLSVDGRMRAQLDRDMSLLRIDDVRRIMIDVGLRLFLADIHATVAVMSHVTHQERVRPECTKDL